MDQTTYNTSSFENLMAIFEEIIPTVLDNGDAAYASMSEISKDVNVERDRRSRVTGLMTQATAVSVACKPEAFRFRQKLRESKSVEKRREFERFATRILKNPVTANYYKRYRDAEAALDALKGSEDKEAILKAEMKLKEIETELCYNFMSETYDTIMKIGDSFEDAYSYDLVKQKDYMPDFVSVMGDVVSEHWKRAAAKVNKALGAEIRKQGKEQEKLEKKIKKEDEAEAKKKAAEAKKKAAEEEEKKKAAKKSKKKK